MPVVDYESAWMDLAAHVTSKRSHSSRDLSEEMNRILGRHRLPEGQEGFDDRPLPVGNQRSARDEPDLDLREPAQIVSAAS